MFPKAFFPASFFAATYFPEGTLAGPLFVPNVWQMTTFVEQGSDYTKTTITQAIGGA